MSCAPTWVVSAGQPVIVTVPPATSAAMRNGAALERSGSMSTSMPGSGRGRRSSAGPRGVDLDAAGGEGRDGHLDVGEARQALARVAQVEAASKRAADSSRAETNWLDADASISSSPPAIEPVPCTVNGSAPRPSSSTSTPSAAGRRCRRPSGGGGRTRRRRT